MALAIALAALLPTLLLNVGVIALSGVRGIGNILGAMISSELVESDGGQQDIDGTQQPDGSGGVYEDMDVIKNDGSININEQVGSTGFGGDLSIRHRRELQGAERDRRNAAHRGQAMGETDPSRVCRLLCRLLATLRNDLVKQRTGDYDRRQNGRLLKT